MHKDIHLIGFWSGVLAFISTVAFCTAQVFQLIGILRFPLDEILIYATSLCIAIPFLLEVLALHYLAANDKKYWTHAALMFSVMYAVFVIANYVVQLATVIPAKLQGTLPEVSVLDQTPHSMFWNFDALGYIFMGLASFAIVLALRKEGFEKWVRIAFLLNALVTPLIGIVYFYQHFSETLLMLGFPWAVTAPLSMLLLALLFKKNRLEGTSDGVQ